MVTHLQQRTQIPLQAQPPDISQLATTTEHLNAVVVSSIDGRPVPRVLVTDTVTVPIKPYEILTVQVFYPARHVASN